MIALFDGDMTIILFYIFYVLHMFNAFASKVFSHYSLTYNPVENVLWRVKKLSQVRRGRKTLTFAFVCYCSATAGNLFSTGCWASGCLPIWFWDFPNISLFPWSLSLKPLKNSWSNWYVKFLTLDIMFRFTCGELRLYLYFVKISNSLKRIVLLSLPTKATSETRRTKYLKKL